MIELVFILDRSGSMSGLEKDTIGGFNAMIEKQKREENVNFLIFMSKHLKILPEHLPTGSFLHSLL